MTDQDVHRDMSGLPAGGDPETSAELQRLVALPWQLIEVADGVIVRRGSIQVLIGGDRAVEVLEIVTNAMRGEGASIDEICGRFAAPDRPAVKELVEQLLSRRFVVAAGSDPRPVGSEDQLEVFYWHFGLSTREVNTRLNQAQVAILGVNHISRQLVSSVTAAGMTNVRVVDYPPLRNVSLFEGGEHVHASRWCSTVEPIGYDDWVAGIEAEPFDCLVATSDFGGLRLMRQWNTLCLERDRHFLPVVLQDMVGYVGPSVIPGETSCFECFLSRLDSNRTGDTQGYASEMAASAGQRVAGFHPSMASVLGDIAAIELTKFYSRGLPLWKTGSVTEVDLLAGRMNSRKVLRVPRCNACSNLIRRSSTSMFRGSLTNKVIEA